MSGVLRTRSGRPASQRLFEVRKFIDLLNAEGVTSYLEIGARHGDTFHEIVSHLPRNSVGVALDLPGGNWGNQNSRRSLCSAVDDLKMRGYTASCLFGDSRTQGTIRLATTRGPYDAILIDGDHLYDGVKADWENYSGLARIIAFHDIDGIGQTTKDGKLEVQVPTLWRELCEKHRHVEIIDPENRGMGIGVIWR